MHVLQLGPYPPPHGGVQSNLVAIHRYLQKQGASSQVINITRHRKPDGDGVYYPKGWSGLCRLLLRLRFDIVHLHIGGTLTPRLLALSFLCCAIPGRRAVLTFHSGGYPSSKEGTHAHARSLRGFVFRRFDRIIGVNPEIVRLFHRFGVKPEKVRLIQPHALPSVLPARNMSEQLKRFFEAHEPVLLTVGLLEPEYDLPLQIDALGLVRRRHPKAGLAIIGSGSIEAELGRLITGTSYGPHVLLCGDVPHEDTLLAMSACDLFLRTSIYDGDSVAVREAIHLGVSVIATDTGMRPAEVHLIGISNSGELVRAIEELLSRPRERRGSPSASEENIEAVVKLYRELMHDMGKSD